MYGGVEHVCEYLWLSAVICTTTFVRHTCKKSVSHTVPAITHLQGLLTVCALHMCVCVCVLHVSVCVLRSGVSTFIPRSEFLVL